VWDFHYPCRSWEASQLVAEPGGSSVHAGLGWAEALSLLRTSAHIVATAAGLQCARGIIRTEIIGPRVAGSKPRFLSGRQSDTVCNIAGIMSRRYEPPPSRVLPPSWWGWAVGLMAFCFSLSSEAASIRGRLSGFEHLRNPVWAAAKSPDKHGYSFREPVTTVPAGMRKLFPLISKEVCVVALRADGGAAAAKPVSVRVSGGRTTPVTLVVPPGTELRFKNADPFDHRLFGVGLSTFPASTTSKGATRRWTPQDAGRYELKDELSPSVQMWVVAQPGVAATAFPSADGHFSLSIEEPGQYTIQAYFAGEAVGRPLAVSVEKRDVDVSSRPLVLATKPPVEDSNP
jgi:hypothetical protein